MRSKVDAFEMVTELSSSSNAPPGNVKSDTSTNTIAEVESDSDLHHGSNRSSEDLVVQHHGLSDSASRARGRRTPFDHDDDTDLEIGATAQSPQRMEVRVDQFYDSCVGGRPTSPIAEEWENDAPWRPGRARRGFGNRVTVEGGGRRP